MKQRSLWILWGILFALCAFLGMIPAPTGFLRFLLTGFSLLFFYPPGRILYLAVNKKEKTPMQLIRNLSGLSLLATLILLILNFLSVFIGEIGGTILYYLLVIVSCPMICSGYWVLSLFGWSCLLMVSLTQLRKIKK